MIERELCAIVISVSKTLPETNRVVEGSTAGLSLALLAAEAEAEEIAEAADWEENIEVHRNRLTSPGRSAISSRLRPIL